MPDHREDVFDVARLRERREEILRRATVHGARNVRVFGSVARNTATSASDIDLLVEMDAGRSLLDLVALNQELEEVLGRRVDVLSEGSVHGLLRERIDSEAVRL